MGSVAHGLRWFLAIPLRASDLLPPTAALIALSLLTGIVAALVAPLVVNPTRSARASSQMWAALYEIRIYLHSPRAIVAALGRFVRWSASYLVVTAPLVIVLTPLMLPWFLDMHARFGLAPLPLGSPVLVRVELADGADGRALKAEGALRVSPMFVVPSEHRAFCNVTLERDGVHLLRLRLGAALVEKRLVATHNVRAAEPSRAAGIRVLWAEGIEPALAPGGIVAVEVVHPPAHSRWRAPWWLWWLLLAGLTALLVRKLRR